jgi:hypothetical protein
MLFLKKLFSSVFKIKLNLGIKTKAKNFNSVVERKIFFPISIKLLYPVLSLTGFFPGTISLIDEIRDGKVTGAREIYPDRLALNWIHQERKVRSKKINDIMEVSLIKKQVNKLDFSREKVCLVDLGCGGGLKGAKIIEIFDRCGIKVEKYYALDNQKIFAEAAAKYVSDQTGVYSEKMAVDMFNLKNMNFDFPSDCLPIFTLLDSTAEMLPLDKINPIIKFICDNYLLMVGVRFSRSGSERSTDVDRLISFYENCSFYFYSQLGITLPFFKKYLLLDHRWDNKNSSLIRGMRVNFPRAVSEYLKIEEGQWFQIGNSMRFRTLVQLKKYFRKFGSIVALNYNHTKDSEDISKQMAVFTVGKLS